MNNRKRVRNGLIIGLLAAAVVGAIWMSLSTSQKKDQAPMESATSPTKEASVKKMPLLQLSTLKGETLSTTSTEKKTVVNLWASWCGPCQEEMPHFQKAFETYGKQVNFRMVNLTGLDNLEKMKEYVEKQQFTFPILLDEQRQLEKKMNVVGIPQTYVVNEKGEIIRYVNGVMSAAELEALMKEITSSS